MKKTLITLALALSTLTITAQKEYHFTVRSAADIENKLNITERFKSINIIAGEFATIEYKWFDSEVYKIKKDPAIFRRDLTFDAFFDGHWYSFVFYESRKGVYFGEIRCPETKFDVTFTLKLKE